MKTLHGPRTAEHPFRRRAFSTRYSETTPFRDGRSDVLISGDAETGRADEHVLFP
jgi:hypothetical protein